MLFCCYFSSNVYFNCCHLIFPFWPERSLTPPGETVVDCTHVPDPREAPRPLLPYRHEVVTRWELQDWDHERITTPNPALTGVS